MSIIDSKHGLEIACARSSCLLRDYHVLAVEGNDTLWPPHVQRVDRKPFQSDFQIDDISSLPNHTSSMQQTLTNGDNSSTTKRTSNTYHSTHPAHRFIHFQNNRTHHQTPLPTTPVPELAHLQILGPPSNPTPSYITAQLPCHPHFSNSTPTYTHRAPHLSPPNTPATPPAQWSAALAHLISSTATSALRTSSPLAATLGRKREFEQRDALARLEGRRAFIKRSEDVEEAREVWERGIKKQYGGGFGVSERGIVEEEESALAEGSGMGKPADTLAILGRRRREVRPRGGDGLDGRVKTLKRMGMVGNLRGRARTEIESALREGMGTGRVGDVEGYGNMDGLEWGNGTARPNTTGITRDEDGVWTTEGQDKLSNNENSVRQEKGGLKKLWARFRKLFSQRREREGEGYIDHDI
ncbi:hypothetical protein K432DRAFT_379308 [Lepidopterella palustris CBS 459.81]|uniref:Uncharacterized protein n=1 Tax=Lepidopterella palustris CBS 459.81 TaxID=1314670 RepID=A0A8E2EHI7_9PEZI|nr:hypothetical protein K432DRAFT_379308 [Lepidopterella palustris CBS 459.81]